MGEHKKDRVHVALTPAALLDLADYCSSARKVSRSDAIRYLVRVALSGESPRAHLDALERMRAMQSSRSPKKNDALLKTYQEKYQSDLGRIHITLNCEDRKDIEAYRDASTIGTRAETIRYLSGLSLAGEFPKDHLKILAHLATEPLIRDRAHRLWIEEGRHENEPQEKKVERWLRAKAEIEEMATRSEVAKLNTRANSGTKSVTLGFVTAASDDVTTYASPAPPPPVIKPLSVGKIDSDPR